MKEIIDKIMFRILEEIEGLPVRTNMSFSQFASLFKPEIGERYIKMRKILEEELSEANNESSDSKTLAETEKDLIIASLEKHSGKRKKVAEELGVSERHLYRKIKQYEIE